MVFNPLLERKHNNNYRCLFKFNFFSILLLVMFIKRVRLILLVSLRNVYYSYQTLIFFVVFYHFSWLYLISRKQNVVTAYFQCSDENNENNYKSCNDNKWHKSTTVLWSYATYYLVFYRYRVKSVAPMISYYSIRHESALLIRFKKLCFFESN